MPLVTKGAGNGTTANELPSIRLHPVPDVKLSKSAPDAEL